MHYAAAALFLYKPKSMSTPAPQQNKKKLFIVIAVIFLVIVVLIGYDISSRTTFPGSKGNLKERIMAEDSVRQE